jgi:hypothetical protein
MVPMPPHFRVASRAWRRPCRGRLLAILPLLGGLALASCTYRGGIDEPVARRATWFSYLDGGDIREACGAGTIDRYRLVYNGRYNEQLRSYEVTGDGAGGGIYVARALNAANLASFTLDDLQGPWRWQRAEGRLSPAEMQEFTAKLGESGMFEAPPQGLRLKSWRFYWVASGCRDGVFQFSAWVHPSPRWDRLAFPEFLFARDRTGVAVNPPRPVPVAEDFAKGPADERGATTRFTLEVDGRGLGGLATIY